ncbi:MAG: hypothetical protein ACI83W_000218 [Marinoscillum sp.]|jgi:uncharacterized protein (TIGR01777 family)
MAKILITGGSGLVGTQLSEQLTKDGHEVSHLSRTAGDSTYPTFKWDLEKGFIDEEAFAGLDHIIHLAGAGVADERWTEKRKKLILDSRVDGVRLLYEYVSRLDVNLKSFVSASAIGIYGWDTGSDVLKEDSPYGKDFLAEVVKSWEAETDKFSKITKVAKVRIGIVLSEKGGALPEILKPIKLYAGAPLGSGEQYLSWIHINDLCAIFAYIVSNNLEGVYNATAPNPVTNEAMTKAIAKTVVKPLFLPNVPAFVMNLMLGEMAQIVLGGNKVSGERIIQTGFRFEYDLLQDALRDLLSR